MKKGFLRAGALFLATAALAGCASTQTGLRSLNGDHIPYVLRKPVGSGPFPAVVVLHDCSGMNDTGSSGIEDQWARALVEQGYVTLMPDSFSSRGYHHAIVCVTPSSSHRDVGMPVRVKDALGALVYLRALPYVDGKRIGVMGGSNGGSATLSVIASQDRIMGPGKGFAAGIAFYPFCKTFPGQGSFRTERESSGGSYVYSHTGTFDPSVPLLILAGERDDWTPAGFCRQLADATRGARYPIRIKIYPGAYHAFDSGHPPNFSARRNGYEKHGAWAGRNEAAAEDAKIRVRDFFDSTLRAKAPSPAS